jgi:hypothetical protein
MAFCLLVGVDLPGTQQRVSTHVQCDKPNESCPKPPTRPNNYSVSFGAQTLSVQHPNVTVTVHPQK